MNAKHLFSTLLYEQDKMNANFYNSRWHVICSFNHFVSDL